SAAYLRDYPWWGGAKTRRRISAQLWASFCQIVPKRAHRLKSFGRDLIRGQAMQLVQHRGSGFLERLVISQQVRPVSSEKQPVQRQGNPFRIDVPIEVPLLLRLLYSTL